MAGTFRLAIDAIPGGEQEQAVVTKLLILRMTEEFAAGPSDTSPMGGGG